jgi:hypothetical protein
MSRSQCLERILHFRLPMTEDPLPAREQILWRINPRRPRTTGETP